MEDTLSVRFVSDGEFAPVFPLIGLHIEVTDVVLATLVLDIFIRDRSMKLDEVKGLIEVLLRDDGWEWEMERDVALRGWQILGTRDIAQHFPRHDEVRIDG